MQNSGLKNPTILGNLVENWQFERL